MTSLALSSPYPGWIDFSLALIRCLVDMFDLTEILEHTTTRFSLNGSYPSTATSASSSSSSSSSPPPSSSSSTSSPRQAYMHQLFKRIVEGDDHPPLEPPPSPYDHQSSIQDMPSLCSEDVNKTNNTHHLSVDNTRNHSNNSTTTTTTITASRNWPTNRLLGDTRIEANLYSIGARARDTFDSHHDGRLVALSAATTAITKRSSDAERRRSTSTTPSILSSQTRLILEDISSFLDSSAVSSSSSSAAAAAAIDKGREVTQLPSSSTIDPTMSHHSKTQTQNSTSKLSFYFSGNSTCPTGPSHGFNCLSRRCDDGKVTEKKSENERRLFKRKRCMQG